MRSPVERIVHTVLFEVIAIAITTPAVVVLTGASPGRSGALSVLISLGALAANAGWTFVFDRWVPHRRRTWPQRLAQAAGLEIIVAVYTVPLTMWVTGIGLLAAVALDGAALVFFLIYGLVYNAAFDAVMLRIERRTLRP